MIGRKLNTPEVRLTLIMMASLAYILSPLVFSGWMLKLQAEGAFPVNADSIGIPIAGFILFWLVCLPIFIFGCFVFESFARRFDSAA